MKKRDSSLRRASLVLTIVCVLAVIVFTLIETFPTSEYAAEARYEMAESYFREGSPSPTAMADAMRWFSDYVRLTPDAAHVSQARQRLLEIQRKLPR